MGKIIRNQQSASFDHRPNIDFQLKNKNQIRIELFCELKKKTHTHTKLEKRGAGKFFFDQRHKRKNGSRKTIEAAAQKTLPRHHQLKEVRPTHKSIVRDFGQATSSSRTTEEEEEERRLDGKRRRRRREKSLYITCAARFYMRDCRPSSYNQTADVCVCV